MQLVLEVTDKYAYGRSYMSAHVLLILLYELGKRDKRQASMFSLFHNEFNKFNKTRARTLDSIYHMTLLLNLISGIKTI